MKLKKVRLETLLLATLAICLVWAATVRADVIESKTKTTARGDCSSAIHFLKIRQPAQLRVDLQLYRPRPYPIQNVFLEQPKKSFELDRMRTEFSRPDNRIKIDFSNMSSVMRLIYSLARWGTLAPVDEIR
jgi:hypothetical protein